MSQSPCIPGLQLSERFYREAVRPILDRTFPGLVYSAALVGPGSDVLGFDTARSTDHGWGPRCYLFLSDTDAPARKDAIHAALREQLPTVFLGYPTNYRRAPHGSLMLQPVATGPVDHQVIIALLPGYVVRQIGFDPLAGSTPTDWLLAWSQNLRELTAGAVFHDGLGLLALLRERLVWYPDAVWRAMLAAQWERIGQEEPFVGRCGEVGDELGSAVVAARLVRDVMRLCFLIERHYAPYSKWLGTAFAGLPCGPSLVPALTAALAATDWRTREHHLSVAYETVATLHNALGLTPPVEARVSPFHDRPFQIIHGERVAATLRATLPDEPALHLASRIGGIDQWADNTDLGNLPDLPARLRGLYQQRATSNEQ